MGYSLPLDQLPAARLTGTRLHRMRWPEDGGDIYGNKVEPDNGSRVRHLL